jgi:TolB protein
VAFGNMAISGTDMVVQGWVYDAKNANAPPVLGKEYHDEPTDDNARLIAHRFADEIITRFGGGIPGMPKARFSSSAIAPATKKSGRWTTTARTRSS